MKTVQFTLFICTLAFASASFAALTPGQKLVVDAKKIYAVTKRISQDYNRPMVAEGSDFEALNTMTCKDSGWDYIACETEIQQRCMLLDSFIYQVTLTPNSCREVREVMDLCLAVPYIMPYDGIDTIKVFKEHYANALTNSGCR